MLANDPTSEQPGEMPALGPAPLNESIAPPSADYQHPPLAEGERPARPPGWQPELELPARSVSRQPRRPHPNLGWSFLWCLLFIFATQIPGAMIAVAVVAGMLLVRPDQFPPGVLSNQAALLKSEPMGVALAIAFFITELLVIGFSLLIIRLVVGRDWKRQLAVRRPSVAHTLLALASFPALVLLGNVSYELIRHYLYVPSLSDYGLSGMEEMTDIFAKWPLAFAVLVIGVGPGIGEELWCRGFLGRGLVGNYGPVLGVLASSFFFGFIHVDPCQGLMAMLMGLWLHYVYLMSRSLWLPMLLHFLNNSLAVIGPRTTRLDFLDAKPGDIPVLVYVTVGLLLAGVAYALYQSRARLAGQTAETPLLWRPEYEGVECPPPDSGTRVAHPLPSPLAFVAAGGGFLFFLAACARWLY
jgi:membrane protease YdiL (CAAX protease family)